MTTTALLKKTPVISIHDGKTVTTSMAVADYFHKTHDNVLKKIRAVIAECEHEYHAVNFNEMVREVTVGDGAIRKSPYFELTRDAFVLIVMGFTGKKALQWKIDYINAFNAMERELVEQHTSLSVPPSGSARIVTHFKNGIVTSQQVLSEHHHIATLHEFLELAQRAEFLVIETNRLHEIALKPLLTSRIPKVKNCQDFYTQDSY